MMTKEILHARLVLLNKNQNTSNICAKILAEFGFTIIKSSPRGIDFEGLLETFKTTFKSDLKTEPSPYFVSDPVIPEQIKKYVESVYFPTKPTFF